LFRPHGKPFVSWALFVAAFGQPVSFLPPFCTWGQGFSPWLVGCVFPRFSFFQALWLEWLFLFFFFFRHVYTVLPPLVWHVWHFLSSVPTFFRRIFFVWRVSLFFPRDWPFQYPVLCTKLLSVVIPPTSFSIFFSCASLFWADARLLFLFGCGITLPLVRTDLCGPRCRNALVTVRARPSLPFFPKFRRREVPHFRPGTSSLLLLCLLLPGSLANLTGFPSHFSRVFGLSFSFVRVALETPPTVDPRPFSPSPRCRFSSHNLQNRAQPGVIFSKGKNLFSPSANFTCFPFSSPPHNYRHWVTGQPFFSPTAVVPFPFLTFDH